MSEPASIVLAMTTAGHDEHQLPTADDESRFWSLLEEAWSQVDESVNQARRSMATRAADSDGQAELAIIDGATGDFLKALTRLSEGMSSGELTDLDRVLERKLYDIDREDIQEVTDGSDDGFLYARGLIVALGRDFYTAVIADPHVAVLDGELESMCYFFAHIHNDKFDTWTETRSGISRESHRNPAGWGSA